MIPVIEAPFRTALMAGLGGLHRAAAGQGPAVRRAAGVATVARRTDREEVVTPAAGLLAEGLVHGVGARGATSDWTASPNRDTTGATGSVCRSSRRSRGSGGTRALTLVFPPVRYPTDRVDTTTGAMDAAALMDAHDASTRCLRNRPEGGFAQRPQPVIFLLIKNPEEPRDRTDATTRVQICALSRERRHTSRRWPKLPHNPLKDMPESSIVGVYDPAERPSAGKPDRVGGGNRQPRLPSCHYRSRCLHRLSDPRRPGTGRTPGAAAAHRRPRLLRHFSPLSTVHEWVAWWCSSSSPTSPRAIRSTIASCNASRAPPWIPWWWPRSRPSTWRWYWRSSCGASTDRLETARRRAGRRLAALGPVRPPRDPIGYGREAMRWRMWSNWRQISAGSGG